MTMMMMMKSGMDRKWTHNSFRTWKRWKREGEMNGRLLKGHRLMDYHDNDDEDDDDDDDDQ